MNQDKLHLFPNQLIDNDQTECVGLTVADICGNLDGQPYDPDILYANALRIMNMAPNTNGLSPLAGLNAAVAFGNLPVTRETFTAKTTSELYIANYQNYPADQRAEALLHSQPGVRFLDGFLEIANWLDRGIGGAALPMTWYASFSMPNPDGTLPEPAGPISNHCVAVYDCDPIKGLLIKPWLGPDYGAGGYAWLSPKLLAQVSVAAYAFDPSAWRWLSLAIIAVTHPWLINDILPQMYATSSRPA